MNAHKEKISRVVDRMTALHYAPSTVKVYGTYLMKFFQSEFYQEPLQKEMVIAFMKSIYQSGHSTSTVNQAVNAIKFYAEQVLGKKREFYYVERPRKEKRIPVVLNLKEVKSLLSTIINKKHHTMISLIYGCGLRCGECLNLEVRDIDGQRKLLHIRNSKGYKDRMIPLSDYMLEMLRSYYVEYRPKKYLFEGIASRKTKSEHPSKYSARSLQNILKRAIQKSGIRKRVTLHTLRHSYATHLLEHGIDLRYIQSLLGHSSPKTTMIYTHISTKKWKDIPSPIDFL